MSLIPDVKMAALAAAAETLDAALTTFQDAPRARDLRKAHRALLRQAERFTARVEALEALCAKAEDPD